MTATLLAEMAEWYEILADLLADRNRSEVARRVGLTPQRITQIVGRKSIPNARDAARLCKYLGTTVEAVFLAPNGVTKTKSAAAQTSRTLAYALAPGRYVPHQTFKLIGEAETIAPEDVRDRAGLVPLLNPIAAGGPRESHDKDFAAGHADMFVRFETDDPQAFALRVDGDSMSPDFRHGDIIVVSPKIGAKRPPYRDGMLGVVIFGSERTSTFKLVFTRRDGAQGEPLDYLLRPINEAHPPLRLKRGEIAAIYPVIGLIRETHT